MANLALENALTLLQPLKAVPRFTRTMQQQMTRLPVSALNCENLSGNFLYRKSPNSGVNLQFIFRSCSGQVQQLKIEFFEPRQGTCILSAAKSRNMSVLYETNVLLPTVLKYEILSCTLLLVACPRFHNDVWLHFSLIVAKTRPKYN